MKALDDIIRQHNHKVKEIEKAEQDIKDLIDRARGLKRFIRTEQKTVDEYKRIIDHCKTLGESNG